MKDFLHVAREREEGKETKRRMHGMENRNQWLLIPVYFVLSCILAFVLLVSLLSPQNNLIPWQMLLGTLLFSAIFLGLMRWESQVALWKEHRKGWHWIAPLGYGVALYGICWLNGNRNHTLADYAAVYQCALEIAGGQQLSFPHYFEVYGNNVMPALFLSIPFRLAAFFSVSEFSVTLFFSVAGVLLSMWSVGELLSQKGKESPRIWAFLLMAACLPIYVHTGVFYTDGMSFGWGVIALALLKKAYGLEKGRGLFAALAGFAAIYGAQWKMTACIPLIAAACVLAVCQSWRRWKTLAGFALFALVTLLLLHVWSSEYPFAAASRTTSNPLSSWVAMGLKGDGSWNESKAFVDEINEMETKAQKKEFARQYFLENLPEAFTWQHVFRKTRRNFASGMLGCSDFLGTSSDETLTWEMFQPWGAYYWRTSQVTFCYMGMIYLVFFLGCVKSLWKLMRHETVPPWKIVADVSFLGIFLFLSLWESNNRQLYNQIPVLVLGLIANGRYLTNKGVNKVESDQ